MIREMTEDEIEWCAGVIRRGFGTVARRFGLTIENCPTNGAFLKEARLRADLEKGNDMYVLEREHSIIGFMQLEKKDDQRVELQKITVIPEFRHYGYGTKMLQFAAQRAREVGVKYLTIGIIEENTILKEWYRKNGFTPDGTRKFEHLPFIVGFMRLEL